MNKSIVKAIALVFIFAGSLSLQARPCEEKCPKPCEEMCEFNIVNQAGHKIEVEIKQEGESYSRKMRPRMWLNRSNKNIDIADGNTRSFSVKGDKSVEISVRKGSSNKEFKLVWSGVPRCGECLVIGCPDECWNYSASWSK